MTSTYASPRARGFAGASDFRRWVRPLLLIALTVVAYHESLRTLLDWLRLDTPLAHLALVPGLALVVAAFRGRASLVDEMHDRELDWIVGIALVGAAFAANRLLPARDSASYWEWRIDLLSLPVFVAGVVCLLFGVRAVWHHRASIGFLFLVWPWPYYQLVDRTLNTFTRSTVRAVGLVTGHLPVAELLSVDAGRFRIGHGEGSFTVLVASSCSGANGMIGYALVGTTLALISSGTRVRKSAWLVTGALFVWIANVARIVVILAAANAWGENVAMDAFHPYLGIVVFVLAIAALLSTAGVFHIRLFDPRATPAPSDVAAPHRPQLLAALTVLAIVTAQIAGLNAALRTSDLMSFTLGPERDAPYASTLEAPDGWSLQPIRDIEWADQYFGSGATWERYAYQQSSADAPLDARGVLIYADVVSSSDRRAMSNYGIESCYQFHEYQVRGRHSADLGSGVTAVVFSWIESGSGTAWTSVYWHWPVHDADGTHYERISLIASDGGTVDAAPVLGAPKLARSLQLDAADDLRGGTGSVDADTAELQRFLTAFAGDLVAERTELS
jgi:exosortase/archaeosortase family protein